jgi:hypothetical protein
VPCAAAGCYEHDEWLTCSSCPVWFGLTRERERERGKDIIVYFVDKESKEKKHDSSLVIKWQNVYICAAGEVLYCSGLDSARLSTLIILRARESNSNNKVVFIHAKE